MSSVVLSQSKLLCYFQIDPAIVHQQSNDSSYQQDVLPLSIYHFHYPAIIYPKLFKHFQKYFNRQTTHNHIRIKSGQMELRSDQPMGLFLANYSTVIVTKSQFACSDGLNMITMSWKRAYMIVNESNGCDHVLQKARQDEINKRYLMHVNGKSNELNKIPTYQGNRIALKIYYNNYRVQRIESKLHLTLRQYLTRQFVDICSFAKVYTHGIVVGLQMTLKQLLEDWNYNDGYCYLKLVSE